jgi:hypothetical protein
MMEIRTIGGQTSFLPGQEVTGTVSWNLPSPPTFAQLQLYWTTRGKGTVDLEVIDSVSFESPPGSAEHPFRFRLPAAGPYSFSGKLISLVWLLKLHVKPSKETVEAAITVSPTGHEINLLNSSPSSL